MLKQHSAQRPSRDVKARMVEIGQEIAQHSKRKHLSAAIKLFREVYIYISLLAFEMF